MTQSEKPLPTPDPEVADVARRRSFTAKYKLRVLRELDAATEPGQAGEVLRREGLYTSHVTDWRRMREARLRADVPEVYVDRPRRRWIAWGELILRVLFQPGCSSSRLQARPPNLPRVRRPDAASGDVLRWLDDERVLPTGLAGAAWF